MIFCYLSHRQVKRTHAETEHISLELKGFDKIFVYYYVSEVSNGKYESASWSDIHKLAFLRRDLITLLIVKKQQEPEKIKTQQG